MALRLTQWLVTRLFVLVVLGCALFLIVHELLPSPAEVKQPLAFNHKQHISKDWTCAACHPYADQLALAGLPKVKDCVECHESSKVTRPRALEVKKVLDRGEEIPWQQVYRVPEHVYFSHRRHTELARLDCKECHGDMARVTRAVTRQAKPISMERCMDCHERKRVTNDCLSCHR